MDYLPLHAMLIRIITWIFVIGIIYRLLSRYIIPIFRITTAHGDRIRQMHDQMNGMDRNANTGASKKPVKKEGDYIDYEEVR
jgi:hypothetical protein